MSPATQAPSLTDSPSAVQLHPVSNSSLKDNAMPGFCTNCGAPLAGAFCGRCGQRAQSASAPQVQPSSAAPQPEPPVTSSQPAAAMPQPTVAAQPAAPAPQATTVQAS